MSNRFLILFLIITLAHLKFAFGQQENISININGNSINDFAKAIETQSHYRFYYDENQFDSLSFALNIRNQPIKVILDSVFKNTKYFYSIINNHQIFLTKNVPFIVQTYAQEYASSQSAPFVLRNLNYKKAAPLVDEVRDNKVYEIGSKSESNKSEMATISGYLTDILTGQPLSGVFISLENTKASTTSDEFGYYNLQVSRGEHLLTLSIINEKPNTRKIIVYSDGKKDFQIKNLVVALKEVVVNQKADKQKNTQMGVNQINIQEIKKIPTVFGEADIVKAILTLPGVKTVGEAAGGFNVRGGSTDQNLILFNDATIYNPSHFFGFFSAFNPDVVNNVELFKSSIPVKYGGRLSSVLNINGREGNKKNITGTAGLGLLTSRLSIEGPLVKDKSSFILSGRTTYSNFIFGLLPDKASYKKSKASFYDINLLLNHKINDKNSINLTGYLSGDASDLGTDTTFSYQNKNLSVKWRHLFSQKVTSSFVLGYDGYHYNNNSNADSLTAYQLNFNINQFYLKSNFSYYLNFKHTIDFGFQSLYYKLKPGSFTPQGQSSLIIPQLLETENAVENALFVGDNYKVNDFITLDFGLRYDYFVNLGPKKIYTYSKNLPRDFNNITDSIFYKKGDATKAYYGPEYRFSARFGINDNSSVKLSYNSLRQFIHLLTNTTAISPTDIWKLSDPNIKPQIGDQFSVGYYKNLNANGIETSVEVYYKNIKNYLDYKSGAQLILNPHIETDVINTKGKAYGVELYVKKTTGKLNGWLSYTYSRTFLKEDDPLVTELINNGSYYPASFDKPHDFSLITNYKFNHRFSFSFNTTYSTGRPITIPTGVFNYAGGVRSLYGDRNGYRIPDYFRADIGFNLEGNHNLKQTFHNSWTFGVYNLTGRKNAYSTYFTSEAGKLKGYKLSIFGTAVPYVNYNIRF